MDGIPIGGAYSGQQYIYGSSGSGKTAMMYYHIYKGRVQPKKKYESPFKNA